MYNCKRKCHEECLAEELNPKKDETYIIYIAAFQVTGLRYHPDVLSRSTSTSSKICRDHAHQRGVPKFVQWQLPIQTREENHN
mgnify:CR=1 FL=1